jgi:hypothetical protein
MLGNGTLANCIMTDIGIRAYDERVKVLENGL